MADEKSREKRSTDAGTGAGASPRPASARSKAAVKDILRTITGDLKRFCSLFVICALGTTMLVGLRAACEDLRASADAYYDAQKLHDVSVHSTLGLTDADIDVLAGRSGVAAAEGGYTETARTKVGSGRENVDVKALSAHGLNEPMVLEGRLPRAAGEVAVTKRYADDAGKKTGDRVTFDAVEGDGDAGDDAASSDSATAETTDTAVDSATGTFKRGSYRIVGIVHDPMDVNADTKTMTFREGSATKYSFFVARAAALDPDVYTVAYLRVAGAAQLDTYGDGYRERVDQAVDEVNDVREDRERARTDEVRAAAVDQALAAFDKRVDAAAEQARAAAQAAGAPAAIQERAAEQARATAAAQRDTVRDQARDRAERAVSPATWYVQDRSALPSYTSVDSDASSIEGIANVFPVLFFAVAVLIGLTTVTRMVEEDRGLIGIYKALGYRRGQILAKYLVYALSASLAGGVAGAAIGFTALPQIVFIIFRTMYALPAYSMHVNMVLACGSVALFAVGIVGAAYLACRRVLREGPAELMRPRAPHAGTRIALEYITPLWRRMSFLNKVSVRNLFRYKKRALMTILGIAGCTALMVCGLGIRDSVIALKPRQYGSTGIVRYDLLAATTDADFDAARSDLKAAYEVRDLMNVRMDLVTAEYGGRKESVQIVVVPDGTDLDAYIHVADEAGHALEVPNGSRDILITKNAEQTLGFSKGDTIKLRDRALRGGSARVHAVAMNYLGNYVFMSQRAYQRIFGVSYTPNAVMAHLRGSAEKQMSFADELARDERFASVTSTARQARDFSANFKIIDVVVYILTVMAALLAFAVVFTLSTTNISERERELATIKVLGFRRREVCQYVNRETLVLAVMGIAVGCPLGFGLTRMLTYVLRMPSLYFDTLVDPMSFVLAGVLSLVFVLVINRITDRSLYRIDMVGALKSAE